MSVKNDIRINPNELDKEWANLPDQFHNYSESGDLLDSELKLKRMEIEILEADLDMKIRLNPAKFKAGEKVTETQIKSIIRTQDDWRDLNFDILELEKQRRLMASACRALEMKRDALKSIQALYLSEFYIAPTTEREVEDFENRQEEMANRNVRTEMRKHSKRKEKQNGTI